MSRVVMPFRLRLSGRLRMWSPAGYFRFVTSNILGALFVSALLSLLLSACATEGDFGRPRPTFFQKFSDDYLASDTTLLGSRGGSGVTEDEVAMRETGNRLAAPLSLASPALISSYGSKGSGYGTNYTAPNPQALALAIDRELAIDHQVLSDFGEAARRVLVTDGRRMQAVYDNEPYLLEADRQSAHARMRENYDFIMSVLQDFAARLQSYRHAIRDIQDAAPNQVVTDARSSLYHLRDRAASLEYEVNGIYRTAVARGDSRPPRPAKRWDAGYASRRSRAPNGVGYEADTSYK